MTKKNNILKQAAAYPHMVWAVLFIIAPLLFVAYYAFTDKNGKLFAYIADGEKYTGINPKKKSASHLETVRNGTDREKGNEEK